MPQVMMLLETGLGRKEVPKIVVVFISFHDLIASGFLNNNGYSFHY